MIVCPRKTSVESISSCLNANWYNDELHRDWLVVDETTDEGKALAKRIVNSFPYVDLVIEDGQLVDIVEWPEVEYSIDKNQISVGEVATVTTETNTTAVIDSLEYVLADGVLEYSNENQGTHVIELKQDKKKPAVLRIEVV